jgi:hypothetical protein
MKISKPYICLHQDLIIQKESLKRKVFSASILCGTSTVSSMKEGSHHDHRHHHLGRVSRPESMHILCTKWEQMGA